MHIRQANSDDLDSILQLGKNVPEFLVSEDTINFWPEEILSKAIGSDSVLILVAETEGFIKGFIIVNLNLKLRKAIIENIYVDPANRDEGIGEMLLDMLLGELRQKPIEYISTQVPISAIRAIRLYENAGFTKGESFLWLDKSLSDIFDSKPD